MILFLRISLILLALGFTFFFGETAERLLAQVIRLFFSVDPSNAVEFNLLHLLILMFPLFLFSIFIFIATIDDRALRSRAASLSLGMLSALLFYRLFQVWWVLKISSFSDSALSGQVENWTRGQIFFIEDIFPFVILGGVSGTVAALRESGNDCVFYSTLASVCIFCWLLITRKLPLHEGMLQSLQSFALVVFSGFITGFTVKRVKES